MSLGALNVEASDILVKFSKTKKFAQSVQRKSIIMEIFPVRKIEQNRKNEVIARKLEDHLIIT